jgi:hypothetical protein
MSNPLDYSYNRLSWHFVCLRLEEFTILTCWDTSHRIITAKRSLSVRILPGYVKDGSATSGVQLEVAPGVMVGSANGFAIR